jgi:serine/threonine protein kinase
MNHSKPRSPLSTSQSLDFPSDYLIRYPWLRNDVRHYGVGEEIGSGAFGVTFHSRPCNARGRTLAGLAGQTELVLKVPVIQRDHRTDEEIDNRLNYITKKNNLNFFHIGERLKDSPHANPLIDLIPYPIDDGRFQAQATVQPLLKNALDLDAWLHHKGYSQHSISRDTRTRAMASTGFSGLTDRQEWLAIAKNIAIAIDDFHRRRVTHADIHPGNIFIDLGKSQRVIFIDFGEAFLATPDRHSRRRNPNPYLAPERLGPRFLLTEQVDVYSFGILLLYLATGVEKYIESDRVPGDYRRIVYDEVQTRNPKLLSRNEPRILDVIARSISRDPADRPRMSDVCEALEDIGASRRPSVASRSASTNDNALLRVGRALAAARKSHSPALISLLELQIRELAATFDGLKTEMVELRGTRDQMLRAMTSLFENLSSGDSWTAATTLAVWQRSALGLDGSYASANIRAVQRLRGGDRARF